LIDNRRLVACVCDDLAQRLFDRAQHDLDAGVLIRVVALEFLQSLTRTQQRHAATGHDAFFDGRTGCVQCVFDAGLLLFHLDFGCSADLDHGNAAGQLGNAFLQLFAVVVARGFFDLDADLLDAGFDVLVSPVAIDDRGVFLADFDALGLAEVGQA
jgi:hypothetical protein